MSQQVCARSLLVLGDSNVRRYLYRAGGAYSETCDCGIVRNLSEFGTSLKMVENTQYTTIIFAMLTNIVIDAGSEGTDQASRLNAIEECLSPLLENFRCLFKLSIYAIYRCSKSPSVLVRRTVRSDVKLNQ
jgi:hypothetical protein